MLFYSVKVCKYIDLSGVYPTHVLQEIFLVSGNLNGCVMFAQTWGKSSWLKLLVSAEGPTAIVFGEKSLLVSEAENITKQVCIPVGCVLPAG